MQSTCPTISSFNWILCDGNVKRMKRFPARTVPVRFILTWLQFYNECKCTLIGFWMSQRAFKHASTKSRKKYSRLPHTASYTCIKFQHEFPFGIAGSNYNWFKFRIRAFRQQYITNSPFFVPPVIFDGYKYIQKGRVEAPENGGWWSEILMYFH